TKGQALVDRAGKLADEIIVAQTAALAVAVSESTAAYGSARLMLFGAFAFALVFGIVIVSLIARYVARSLAGAADLARSVASGDLTRTAEVINDDEIGKIG